jgi:CBS domain-containing protein
MKKTIERMEMDGTSERDEKIITVKDLMTQNIISILPETSVVEATRIMSARDISSILIKTGDDYIGIFTDRDIMRKVVASGLDPNDTAVREIMSSPLITISEDAGIQEAAEKMRDRKIRRLVVISEGVVVGIISETDIARVEPELHLLIREHSKLQLHPSSYREDRKSFVGFCEECNNYSSLENINGRWLCQECR